jgi:GTP cyclohydrolase I
MTDPTKDTPTSPDGLCAVGHTCGECETSGMCANKRERLGLYKRAAPPHGQIPDAEYCPWLIRDLLRFIGENPDRPGLLETPVRVMKAWKHDWCSGYNKKPEDVLKVFEDGAEGVNEMVVVQNLEFYSHCEHHMAPFFGKAHIAYIPAGKIVGLSKLGRVLDIYAKRLQVQERLTTQIADAIEKVLNPLGVGVVIEATHFCMCSRGVQKQSSTTVTSALRGAFLYNATTRAEFMALVRNA